MDDGLRLRYRYLDLRRPEMQSALRLRHELSLTVRNFLSSQGFLEIETPMLTRSTPEGARDYLVPSRVNPGTCYALPQSPQLFKQILMIAGYDRYFQIARCFRDEDLRADRQPEFTQVDIEMAFIEQDDLFEVVEGIMAEMFKVNLGLDLPRPFPRITYPEAMSRYGSDRPDLRSGLELVDVSDLARESTFSLFRERLDGGAVVRGLRLPEGATYSRRMLDELTERVKDWGAGGLFSVKITQEGPTSPIVKHFAPALMERLLDRMRAREGDLLLLLAEPEAVALEVLGRLRVHLAETHGLVEEGSYRFTWVVDFPLLEKDLEGGGLSPRHHPFTSPAEEDLPLLETDPLRVRAKAYDLVLNGSEIGGGSIRIHRRDVQQAVFRVLGIGEEEGESKFGFLLEALQFGAPPHGGIALGFDRIAALLAGAPSIREVIAFPKTSRAACLMTGAPSPVDLDQLATLGLTWKTPSASMTRRGGEAAG